MNRGVITILAVISLIAAALLVVYGLTLRTLLDIALVAGTLLPELLRRIPSLYLRWTKFRFYLANSTATWDISIRLEGVGSAIDVPALAQDLMRWANDGAIISQESNRVVLRVLRRFVVDLAVPRIPTPGRLDDHGGEIDVAIHPVTVGYRDSHRFLDDELLPLIEKVRELVPSNWASYTLRVDLPESNPYFGLYLQTFDSGAIQDFRIQFVVPSRDDSTKILVAKTSMTVIAGTLEQFRTAISAALAFKIPEG